MLPQELVNEVCNEKKTRFLVIGGPVAVAENLEQGQSYPSLLCNSDRIASPDLKPDDVAPCIQKIIGINVYDAIV